MPPSVHVVEFPSWLQSASGRLAKADRLSLTLGRRKKKTLGRRMEWSADDTLRRDTQDWKQGNAYKSGGHLQMAGMQRSVCQE